jgi:hypothetical protein
MEPRILLSTGEESGGNSVWLVPRFRGEPRRLAGSDAPYVAVSPDGVLLAGAWQDERGFRIVPVSGGQPQPVRLDGVRWVLDLRWAPGGRRLAVRTDDEDRSAHVSASPASNPSLMSVLRREGELD